MTKVGFCTVSIRKELADRIQEACKKRSDASLSGNASYLIKKGLGDDVQ